MLKVSILMPMRNTERYVRDAVMSVLNQEGGDVDLVVVDDESTDRSLATVESIADPRIKLLSGGGRGVSVAWNTAFANAIGDIIMQCDSDDLYPRGRVAWQLGFLTQHAEFGAVCGGFSTIEATGRKITDLFNGTSVGEEITEELLNGVTRTSLCTFAVRRRYLERIGGKREYFESAEDIDLQIRLAEVCRVWFEPRSFYSYRLHDKSITHRQASARRTFYEQYARELRKQRTLGNADDLERGQAREPPGTDSPPDRSAKQIQGMLLGEAWQRHARGSKILAIKLGLRALFQAPLDISIWRSLAALVIKPVRSSGK
jgi:glycosyltransferase involved in cell wall biosynthesis